MKLNPATRAAYAFIEGTMSFQLKVFVNGKHTVTETNPESIAFWNHRKRIREFDGVRVTFEITGLIPEKQKRDPVWLTAYN
jgi:hypothetical protein